VNITGILVSAHPDQTETLRERLTAIAGVEVHAVTPEGHMVVTIERPTDGEMTGAFDAIHQLPGVLSAALVYHHDEPVDE
jgi:periplasmic nitrate reductase NapD